MKTKNRIKMSLITIIVLCICIVTFIFLHNGNAKVFASETIEYEQKVYSNAAIDDDFDGTCILVILDKKISGFNKIHNENFFGGFEKEYVEDIFTITSVAAMEAIDENEFRQIYKIQLPTDDKENVLAAIAELAIIEGIKYAGPNYFSQPGAIPDDTSFNSQWALNGKNGINAPAAWDITTGSKNVRVGIIDTGISNHPDLDANVVEGWDFYNDNAITNDDTDGHGTHVAGIVGAVGNNNRGITGVNWNVSLVPLQASNPNDKNLFYSSVIINAIRYAVNTWGTNKQIDILNYSVSGFGSSMYEINEVANKYPGLFVWAAGNKGENLDDKTKFPQIDRFKLPNLISVGSTTQSGARSSSSNYGLNSVDIYAPGRVILSTVPWGLITGVSMSGTSMAAPHVAGVAALMLSANPELSAAELKELIVKNSDTITISTPSGSQNVKKINAYKAVASVMPFKTQNLSDGTIAITGTHINFNNITGIYNTPRNTLEIPSQINGGTVAVPVGPLASAGFARII